MLAWWNGDDGGLAVVRGGGAGIVGEVHGPRHIACEGMSGEQARLAAQRLLLLLLQ